MTTDRAWAYLDISYPLCAWNVYRGALLSPPNKPRFLSVWCASVLAASTASDRLNEYRLDQCRSQKFPERISRLRGIYCFLSVDDAVRAGRAWGRPFTPDKLAELNLDEAGQRRDKVDSNWIKYAPCHGGSIDWDESWFPQYWAGVPFPDKEPIWETFVDGRLWVMTTELRKRAYDRVKTEFPNSLALMELARLAALAGSDHGNMSGVLAEKDGRLLVDFCIDDSAATDSTLPAKFSQLWRDGHPINYADLAPSTTDAAPNMQDYRLEIPFIQIQQIGATDETSPDSSVNSQ